MKKLFAAVLLMFLVFTGGNAYALSLSAGANAFLPSGNFQKDFNPGISVNVSAYQEIKWRMGLKFNYNFYATTAKKESVYHGGRLTGNSFELLVQFVPIDFIVRPYIAAGGGYYLHKITSDYQNLDQKGFGFVAEAGVGINLTILNIGISARYFAPTVKGGGVSSKTPGFTVGGGITLKIPLLP